MLSLSLLFLSSILCLSNFIQPLDGLSINEIKLSNVDFPEPEGPIKEYIFPGLKIKFIFFKTSIFFVEK